MTQQEVSRFIQGLFAFELSLSQHVDNIIEDDSVADKVVGRVVNAENVLSQCIQELNDLGFTV